jgi:hypothetical protein
MRDPGDEADDRVVKFRYVEVRAEGGFDLLGALRREAINIALFKPLPLKSADGLNIRLHCPADERLFHDTIIATPFSSAAT